MRTVALVAFVVAIVAGGCKKSKSYDRSTPEKALESFFSALNAGEIPDRLGLFVSESENEAWQMRCESRGCNSGKFTIVDRHDDSDSNVTLFVDYQVMSKRGRVMKGDKSPIDLIRVGDAWQIDKFGRQAAAPPAPQPQPASDGGAQPSGDAAAEQADAAPSKP
jgi:hypothetical protein